MVSTLTEEQEEKYRTGKLVVPADVAEPGDGKWMRQWWYDQQTPENKARIDDGEFAYPTNLLPENFTDTFALGDNTNISLLSNGRAYFTGAVGIGTKDPQETLDVRGKIVSSQRITVKSYDDNSVARQVNFAMDYDGDGSAFRFNSLRPIGGDYTNAITKFYMNGKTTDDCIMSFLPGNLVGVNTSDPQATLDVNGHIRTSEGIVFGDAAGNVTSKTLNDYEEGTWTPKVEGDSTAGKVNYLDAVGKYTRVGRVVTITLRLSWNSEGNDPDTGKPWESGDGLLNIVGLPYRNEGGSKSGTVSPLTGSDLTTVPAGTDTLSSLVLSSQAKFQVRASEYDKGTGGGTNTFGSSIDWSAKGFINCSIVYFTKD